MVNLSIIVVSYNTADLTIACLNSVNASLKKYPVQAEIIVVDNASTDESVNRLKSYRLQVAGFRLLENKTNVGFGKANNMGLRKAEGKYVLFLNSDTLIDDVNFQDLISVMDKDEKIGVLTVRVSLENGSLDPASHRGFPTIWRSFTYFSKLEGLTKHIPILNRFFGGYHLAHLSLGTTHEIDSPSGAFFLTRKSILDEVGGFDEMFFMYGEDLDLSMRIKKLGYKILFYPNQSITHLKGKSGMKHDDTGVKRQTSTYFYDAMKTFYDKHYMKKYPKFVNNIVHFFINSKIKVQNSKFMRLGIDARLLTQTGVGVYTRNLLQFLPKYLPTDAEVVVFVRTCDKDKVPNADRYKIVESNYRWHTFGEQFGFLLQLLGQRLDLMHFTYFSYPVLYKKPFVSTIHDLTPVLFKTGKASTKSAIEYYPKYFAMSKVISSAVKDSVAVITPTKFVKKQLVETYSVDGNKVHAIAEGISEELKNAKENMELKKKFSKPFFIYIGNFYPHKNVETLIRAFAKVDTKYNVVLIGPQDFFSGRVEQSIKEKGLTDRVSFFYNATLADLVFFYKNAVALVQPSLSEGFGLTPIEAMHFGCPVVASDIEVFKETLGDSYISFDPKDADSISKALQTVGRPKSKGSKSISENFSFDKMAKETVEVYNKTI